MKTKGPLLSCRKNDTDEDLQIPRSSTDHIKHFYLYFCFICLQLTITEPYSSTILYNLLEKKKRKQEKQSKNNKKKTACGENKLRATSVFITLFTVTIVSVVWRIIFIFIFCVIV